MLLGYKEVILMTLKNNVTQTIIRGGYILTANV